MKKIYWVVLQPLFCLLLLLVTSCKKDGETVDYQIDVVVSNFKAESVRIVLTDTLDNKIYYDKVIVDSDPSSVMNEVKDSFTVPKGIPKFLYKMRLEGPTNSLVTVNLNHKLGSLSQGIGSVVTKDPNDKNYWVRGKLEISVHLQ